MRKRTRSNRSLLVFLILGILILTMQAAGLLDALDHRLKDYHYQTGGLISPEIYVIGIDEETLEELGPWQSWSREKMAEIIRMFNADPSVAPAVIGVDVGFFGETGGEADEALAEAAGLFDNVVTTSYVTFGKDIVEETDGTFVTEDVVMTYEVPYDGLREHVSWGFSNVPLDEDGIVRHSLYRIDMPEEQRKEAEAGVSAGAEADSDGRIYSFAAEVYLKYMGELPEAVLGEHATGYIPFAGYPYDFYGTQTAGLSFSAILNGEIPPEMFAGTIVLIGPYSMGMMDSYYTAISRDTTMYGVEVHANVLQALLEDTMKQDLDLYASLALTAAVMVLVWLILRIRNLAVSTALTAVTAAAYWWLAGALYESGTVVSLLYPFVAIGVFYIYQIVLQYVSELLAKRHIQQVFGKYVSKDIVANIVKGGEDALKLGGQKKDVAVLFVDIRGFTPLSEALEPEQVVEILNRYLEMTTAAVFGNRGTVDKFIGDATMALFNAPLDLDDYVFRAVKTGLDMVHAAGALEQEVLALHGCHVGFGVGIHCGEAVIGNIGTAARMDYTAIGSTVNTAARLESQAAAGQVLISDEVRRRLEGRIAVTSVGFRKLKGIAEEMEVFRVDAILDAAEK